MLSKGINPKEVVTKTKGKVKFNKDPMVSNMIKQDILKNGSTENGVNFWFGDN